MDAVPGLRHMRGGERLPPWPGTCQFERYLGDAPGSFRCHFAHGDGNVGVGIYSPVPMYMMRSA